MARGLGPTLPTLMMAIRKRQTSPAEFGGHEQDEEQYEDEGGSDDNEENYDTPDTPEYWRNKHQAAMHNMLQSVHSHDVEGLGQAHRDGHEALSRLKEFDRNKEEGGTEDHETEDSGFGY